MTVLLIRQSIHINLEIKKQYKTITQSGILQDTMNTPKVLKKRMLTEAVGERSKKAQNKELLKSVAMSVSQERRKTCAKIKQTI